MPRSKVCLGVNCDFAKCVGLQSVFSSCEAKCVKKQTVTSQFEGNCSFEQKVTMQRVPKQ